MNNKIIERIEIYKINNSKIFDGKKFSPLMIKASSFPFIGFYEIGLNEIDKAKYNFFKATYIHDLINNLKQKTIYPLINVPIEWAARFTNGDTFISALNCGDEEMLQRFAKNLQKTEMDAESDYRVIAGMLKKAFITNNLEEIEYYKNKLFSKNFSKNVGFEKGDILCMKGILEKNVEMFNEGVEIIIKAFKREASSWVYNGVSLQATALVKLGQRMGLKPDISNKLISKELLNAENKTFEEDDELKSVLQQLEDMNNGKKEEEKKKDGGFFGKLFGG